MRCNGKHHSFGGDLRDVSDAGALSATLKNAGDARAQMITLALVLGAHEAQLGVHTWRSRNPCGRAVSVTDRHMGLRPLGDRAVRDEGRLR